jgi:HAD superfamily hydrolase (TIGR01509 family)
MPLLRHSRRSSVVRRKLAVLYLFIEEMMSGVNAAPAAVVFDNDGLLLDTEEAWTRAEQRLFAGLGHKRILIGSSRTMAAAKLEVLLERAGEGEALMDELLALVMEEALAGVAPRPGARRLLERLGDAGVPLAVASNSERQFVQRTLQSAGLYPDGPFAVVVSANDVEHPKPAPDIYLEACRLLGVSAADAVALEDSPIGVASAAAAGMFVIAVPYFAGTELAGASMQADSLDDRSVAEALGLQA